jgi:hypothetical protein
MADSVGSKLREVNAAYCDRLFAIAKPVHLKGNDCLMSCYRNSTASLEDCDQCAQRCEVELRGVRGAQALLGQSMVLAR